MTPPGPLGTQFGPLPDNQAVPLSIVVRAKPSSWWTPVTTTAVIDWLRSNGITSASVHDNVVSVDATASAVEHLLLSSTPPPRAGLDQPPADPHPWGPKPPGRGKKVIV